MRHLISFTILITIVRFDFLPATPLLRPFRTSNTAPFQAFFGAVTRPFGECVSQYVKHILH
jgi:hypothetical protein